MFFAPVEIQSSDEVS